MTNPNPKPREPEPSYGADEEGEVPLGQDHDVEDGANWVSTDEAES